MPGPPFGEITLGHFRASNVVSRVVCLQKIVISRNQHITLCLCDRPRFRVQARLKTDVQDKLLFLILLGALGLLPAASLAQLPEANQSQAQTNQPRTAQTANTRTPSAEQPELGLPASPAGVSTVIGGEISQVDQVLDTLTLKIPGGHSMKIFFDPRTKLYRDGASAPLKDLRKGQHASIQTALAGTKVFAVSIHMLTAAPSGECQGQVLSYDPESGTLFVRSTLSPIPVKLRVSSATPITRAGQAASAPGEAGLADLVPGALVKATFTSGRGGAGVARAITVLAQPGSAFEFAGTISYLNLSNGTIVLLDPRTQKTYTISFNPSAMPGSQNLHEGEPVIVTASFDGSTYTARKITLR